MSILSFNFIEPVLPSILDDDLYKLTMQNAVIQLFPEVEVESRFQNRRKEGKFNLSNPDVQVFKKQFLDQIDIITNLNPLSLQYNEAHFLKEKCSFFPHYYLDYLRNFRFKKENLDIRFVDDELEIDICGLWHETILWEIVLMALISEIYFKTIDRDWDIVGESLNQERLAYEKAKRLIEAGVFFADFGTRRRRSREIHEAVIRGFIQAQKENLGPGKFLGTSNVRLAQLFNLTPIGTMAHEWPMAMSVLEGLLHANFYAMKNWIKVYNADLGIALPDTYGSENFFNNFNLQMSKVFDGIRHDSGDPFIFGERVIRHYKENKIDPLSKTIVFSDSLDVDLAIKIHNYFKGKIKTAFGIGTHFTNDVKNLAGGKSDPMNMVIKLWSVNWKGRKFPVVKLSDNKGKVMGDPDAVRVAQWTFNNIPLDERR